MIIICYGNPQFGTGGNPTRFLFTLVLASTDAVTMPIAIAGAEHARGVQFWFVATRALLAMSVPTLLALFAQRFIVRGLTFGAVKG